MLLVTNSHLEHFYPLPWLAADGLIGNSLFFLLAGYGLALSERQNARPFGAWLWRRIDRIYPALVPVVLVFGLLIESAWRQWSVGDYLRNFGWPTRYTFVQLVIPFYLVFFPIVRAKRRGVYAAAIAALTLVYVAGFLFDVRHMTRGEPLHLGTRSIWVHAPAYLQVMLLGGWLAASARREAPCGVAHPIALAVLWLGYVGAKLAMVRGIDARAYPVLHLLTFVICLGTFGLLTRGAVVRRVQSIQPLWVAATFLGGLTLEIYLVHTYTAEYRWLWRLPFPANITLFWLVTLPLAVIVARVAARLQNLWGERPHRVERGASGKRPIDDVGPPIGAGGA